MTSCQVKASRESLVSGMLPDYCFSLVKNRTGMFWDFISRNERKLCASIICGCWDSFLLLCSPATCACGSWWSLKQFPPSAACWMLLPFQLWDGTSARCAHSCAGRPRAVQGEPDCALWNGVGEIPGLGGSPDRAAASLSQSPFVSQQWQKTSRLNFLPSLSSLHRSEHQVMDTPGKEPR